MTALTKLFFLAATVIALGLVATAAIAQKDMGCSPTLASPCSGGSGGGSSAPVYSPPAVYQPSPADLRRRQMQALNRHAISQAQAGNFLEAIRLYKLALSMSVSADDIRIVRQNMANAYDDLGDITQKEKNFLEARRLYEIALSLSSSASRINAIKASIGNTYAAVGASAYDRGDLTQALRDIELALKYRPNGKFSDGETFAKYAVGLRDEVRRQAAEERRQVDEQQRQAEEQRNAANKKLAVATSVESLKASIEASARAREQKHSEVSQLVGELKSWNADKDGEALKLQIRLEAERLAAAPRTQTQYDSASAQLDAMAKDPKNAGCIFDGRPNCPQGTPLVINKGSRGTATLSVEVLQAMRKSPALNKLLDEEVRADAALAKAKDKLREKELALTNARDAAEKSRLQLEVVEARQEDKNAISAKIAAQANIEEAGRKITVVRE